MSAGKTERSLVGPLIAPERVFLRYASGIVLIAVLGAVRYALIPFMGSQAPLLPFVIAIPIVMLLAGLGPALLAAAFVPLLTTLLFTQWPHDDHAGQWGGHVALFVTASGLIILVLHRVQVAVREQHAAWRAAREAEQRAVANEARLRETDRRRDAFLAMLAHELRNPLAAIRNVAHILGVDAAARDSGTIKRTSELLQRQVNQLSRLIDDLLDVARVTHGKIELQRARQPLDAILSAAIETVQPLLSARQQVLGVIRSTPDLWVDGDAIRLSQVFGNLLGNAAKYSPHHATIELFVERAGTQAVIRVKDSGAGIDAQLLPRVFELFTQADQPLDRKQGGLGVGLTIVKALVTMHGGTVEARSAGVDQGSEFEVRLPLVPGAVRSVRSAPLEPRGCVGRRILIVEDNSDVAESLTQVLTFAGHTVKTAHDGAAALGALETFPAQFVLLDIGLPGVDGYAVAQSIREKFGTRPPHVYALTGYGRTEDRELAAQSGFDGHLTKPVELDRLLDLMQQGDAG